MAILGQIVAIIHNIGHIWPMLKTYSELLQDLGRRIGARRKALGWTQQAAAERSGVNYRTWRRLEGMGQASVQDLVKAAVALRCEEGLEDLFPAPVATTLDELLRQQKARARQTRARGV
ncbi:helix-turn-helix transcriptional regulator [Phenylobacterium sp.]|uniref:helix-turn-helix domain-containing protein n=1 Tax=Phenylobacterium sp. TaxID=1871053 RepID=UPI0030F3BE1E